MLIIAALIIAGYTNHAGNVIAGFPVKLTHTQVELAECGTKHFEVGFCAKSESVLRGYLEKQVESGTITPAERKALGR